MLVFNVDEIKKCLNDVVGEDKMYALGLLEWAIDKRSIEAIPIFDDVTNGDMIKAMFPNFKFNEEWKATRRFELQSEQGHIEITGIATNDWWNAPYKENING
jgi:hypothetical protein